MIELNQVVQVRGHYHRSIQLAQDWRERNGLSEYLLTATARELAAQILRGLQAPKGERAWSITGPYGTGKSAFALFLTDALAGDHSRHAEARALRHELGFRKRPFIPVLVVGQRAPFAPVLLTALAASVKPFDSALARVITSRSQDNYVSDGDVIAIVERVVQAAHKANFGGLLLVVDEFGKFLEYTSLHPDVVDLFVLQHLAEFAARSSIPMVLTTILHTTFSDYLHAADETQRAEWQKVQGRFADVAFHEPPEQLLQLVGASLSRSIPPRLETAYEHAIGEIVRSPIMKEAQKRLPLSTLMSSCRPLHPLTALLLWPLFRSTLAQNERSLFAFLAGREPHGFQEFLSNTVWRGGHPPFYQVDQLYDYVTSALGGALYVGDRAHHWAELSYAIDRVPADAPTLSKAVLKVVGLVGMFGTSVGLRASKELILTAFDDSSEAAMALAHLESASIVIFRRHEQTYGLWEGSDVDLESCYQESRNHVGQGELAARFRSVVSLRPVVARRHYIKSGTLRYFLVDIIEGTEHSLREAIEKPIAPADGQILYILAPSQGVKNALGEFAKSLGNMNQADRSIRIFALPKPIAGLGEALAELECWLWVRENTLALQGDPVARKEVSARIAYARDRLERVIGAIFGLGAQQFDPSSSEWVQSGAVKKFRSAREFMEWLSQLCDNHFAHAPVLSNELLNRDKLSSAAAKARRNLLEAMITREKEPNLAIVGNPPELSMYRSLLFGGGFHVLNTSHWRFGDPGRAWQPVWRAIHDFLDATRTGRRPVRELFTMLKQPPFGLRDGPLPVLLCAALLVHRDDVALYEQGLFVPELRIEVLERLLRVPDDFEIQEYKFDKYQRAAFAAAYRVIQLLQLSGNGANTPQLVPIVKSLVVFATRLPMYAKHTKRIEPPEALVVRDVLLKARDPNSLMFVELPTAMGMSPGQSEETSLFAQLLEKCLTGLRRAYPCLLDEVEAQVRQVFDLNGNSAQAREQLQKRAAPLIGYAADRTLALFVHETSHLSNVQDWRQTVARIVNRGMPPEQWHDADVVTFQVRLQQIASDFVRLEELVSEHHRTGAVQILRIGLLDGHVQEARAVVAVTPQRAPAIESLAKQITELFADDADESEESRRIQLAALAQVAARYLRFDGSDDNGR